MPFTWTDPATGASCQGDLGDPPLISDQPSPSTKHDEEKTYEGYVRLPLSLHIPVPVPHWHVMEVANLVDQLTQQLPNLLILNTEFTGEHTEDDMGGSDTSAPGQLDRAVLLTTWEDLSYSQRSPSSQPRQLDRHSSLALWRYRREAYAAQSSDSNDQGLHWPTMNVLQGPRHAVSLATWPAEVSDSDVVLPPADLILVMTPEPRLLTYQTISDMLQLEAIPDSIARISRAADRPQHGQGGQEFQECFAGCETIELGQFTAIDDNWLD